MSDASYAISSTILDCKKPMSGSDYSKASYPDKPTCNKNWPSCDTSFYGAYALDSSYNGYVDYCSPTDNNTNACDLKFVNAKPKTVIGCWQSCCDKDMTNCDANCHADCVVAGGGNE